MTNVESTGTIRHFRRLRQLALIAPLAVTASAMVCSSASAAPEEEKVFVCKFVGTPGGADETLQTGQNPVSVSVNALPAGVPAQVGSTFNDQQGRSVVLAFDVGQPDPDVSECEQFLQPPSTSTTTPGNGGSTPTTDGGSTPTTDGRTPDTTLADTGADNASLIGAALIFILGGGIALAAARRRAA